jgi:hypothetical protein
MELNWDRISQQDGEQYLRILISVAKSDPENGPKELAFIKHRAVQLGLDAQSLWASTDRHFSIPPRQVSRRTALVAIKDCIHMASLNHDFALFEKSKIYELAEKIGIPRSDVERVRQWVESLLRLHAEWDQIVSEE